MSQEPRGPLHKILSLVVGVAIIVGIGAALRACEHERQVQDRMKHELDMMEKYPPEEYQEPEPAAPSP
jgi:hypothetical protein